MVPDRDLGAGSDEAFGNRAAKTLRAAGDDGAAAVQVDLVHRRFPFTRSFVVPHGEERPCASRTMRPQTGPHPSRRRCAAPQDEGHSQSVQPPSTTWATPVVNAL